MKRPQWQTDQIRRGAGGHAGSQAAAQFRGYFQPSANQHQSLGVIRDRASVSPCRFRTWFSGTEPGADRVQNNSFGAPGRLPTPAAGTEAVVSPLLGRAVQNALSWAEAASRQQGSGTGLRGDLRFLWLGSLPSRPGPRRSRSGGFVLVQPWPLACGSCLGWRSTAPGLSASRSTRDRCDGEECPPAGIPLGTCASCQLGRT